ncbi:uncharacterized protein B0I36DRAFT_309476 [Microdochium trichocladiopsis]|uniref:Fucose-specific lectin n=1 Tax=Microdochium trichocladiopsis TaxID=1682393 RepID=A0A9P9BV14_9PEZI|nr:uncharacterized protein B0I36DRAFT_309476 [Microdochium trichocladiopsis]KAH7039838.1 hypothetical protein B0I36DRAFT_309476 [Microdochium trichocladiopsis]
MDPERNMQARPEDAGPVRESKEKSSSSSVPSIAVRHLSTPSRVFSCYVLVAAIFTTAVIAIAATSLFLRGFDGMVVMISDLPKAPGAAADMPNPMTALASGPPHTLSTALHSSLLGFGLGRYEFSIDPRTHVLRRRELHAAEVRQRFGNDTRESVRENPQLRRILDDPSGGEWQAYDQDGTTRFLTAPVVVSSPALFAPGSGDPLRHHMLALEYGTGAVLQAVYHPQKGSSKGTQDQEELSKAWARPWAQGTPGSWAWDSAGGGPFAWQPTISLTRMVAPTGAGQDFLDVFAVTADGALMKRCYTVNDRNAGGWLSGWVELGRGFVGEVSLEANYYLQDKRRGLVVHAVAIKGGEYQHAVAKAGPRPWDGEWDRLGRPDECRDLAPDQLGYPVVVVWGPLEAEIIVVCGGKIRHKIRDAAGQWSAKWEPFGRGVDRHDRVEDMTLETHGLSSDGFVWKTLAVQVKDSDKAYQIRRAKPDDPFKAWPGLPSGTLMFHWDDWRSF